MKRALLERVVRCLKDRTDAFIDYYPCMKDNAVRSQLCDSWIACGIPDHFQFLSSNCQSISHKTCSNHLSNK